MTSFRRRGLLALSSLAAGAIAAPSILRAQPARTLADSMAADPRFARFLELIVRASAMEDFRQSAPITVLAPVDAAFLNAPAGLLQDLLGQSGSGQDQGSIERTRVLALIRNHVVAGNVMADPAAGAVRRIQTVNGGHIEVSGTGTAMTLRNPAPGQQTGSVGQTPPAAPQVGAFGAAGMQSGPPAQIIGTPIAASNGTIYPISQIIWP